MGEKSKVYALWFHYTMGVSRKHDANKSLHMLMEAITQQFGNGLGKVHSFPQVTLTMLQIKYRQQPVFPEVYIIGK